MLNDPEQIVAAVIIWNFLERKDFFDCSKENLFSVALMFLSDEQLKEISLNEIKEYLLEKRSQLPVECPTLLPDIAPALTLKSNLLCS